MRVNILLAKLLAKLLDHHHLTLAPPRKRGGPACRRCIPAHFTLCLTCARRVADQRVPCKGRAMVAGGHHVRHMLLEEHRTDGQPACRQAQAARGRGGWEATQTAQVPPKGG